MIIIQETLIADEILERRFLCNLEACKGACCWEGDYGAPLEEEELLTLEAIFEDIKPYLSPAGIQVLEEKGRYEYFNDMKKYGTTLMHNGACAYLTLNDKGVAQCGIEKAYQAGATTFKKPISCHLYPIRISKNPQTGIESLQYDEWEICAAACHLGEAMQLPVYRFLREAIIRKYGASFYEELESAAAYQKK